MIHTMNKHINNGFTLIETIFSLFIITISISLLIQTFPILRKISNYDLHIDEEIGIKQIQELVLLGTDFLFDESELRFYYMQEDISLEIDENRLVRTDGYVIYLEDIEDAYFSKKGSCYYLNYNNTKRFLGCE